MKDNSVEVYFPDVVWKLIVLFITETDKYNLVYKQCSKFYETNSESGIIRSFNRRFKFRFCYFKHHHSRASDHDGTQEVERAFFYKHRFIRNGNLWQRYENKRLTYSIESGLVHLIHNRTQWKSANGHVLPTKMVYKVVYRA